MATGVRIGGAYVALGGDASGFKRAANTMGAAVRRQRGALRRLRGETDKVNRRMRAFAGGLLKVQAVSLLLTAAGGGGVSNLIRSASKLGADLVELSAATGVAVRELQGLQRVFEADGVAAERTSRSLRDFLRRTGEAAQGMTSYKRAFDLAGVSIKDFNGRTKSQLQLLLEVADGIRALPTQADRASVAYNLFGRAGTALVPILQQGSQHIIEQTKHFEQFGIVTAPQARRLKEIEQRFTNLGYAAGLIGPRLVADFAGPVQRALASLAQGMRGFEQGLRDVIGAGLRNFGALRELLTIIGILLAAKITGLLGLGRAVIAAARAYGVLRGALLTAAAAGRVLGRVLLVGLAIEALLVLIDVVKNLSVRVRELGADWTTLSVIVVRAVDRMLEAIGSFPYVLGRLFAKGQNINLPAVGDVVPDIADLIFSPEELARADALGTAVSDAFGDAVRQRLARIRESVAVGGAAESIIPDPIGDAVGGGKAQASLLAARDLGAAMADRQRDSIAAAREELRIAGLYGEVQARRKAVGEAVLEIARARARVAAQLRVAEAGAAAGDPTAIARAQELRAALQALPAAGTAAYDALVVGAENYGAALYRIQESTRRVAEFTASLRNGLVGAFESMITGAKSAGAAVRALVAELAALVLRQAVLQPIAGGITSILSSALGPLVAGFGGGGAGAFNPAAPGSATGGTLVHDGGPVEAGGVYHTLRNERFVPSVDGFVLPPPPAQAPMVFNFNFDISSTDGPGVRSAIEAARPVLQQDALNAVNRAMSGPSQLRRAARG